MPDEIKYPLNFKLSLKIQKFLRGEKIKIFFEIKIRIFSFVYIKVNGLPTQLSQVSQQPQTQFHSQSQTPPVQQSIPSGPQAYGNYQFHYFNDTALFFTNST